MAERFPPRITLVLLFIAFLFGGGVASAGPIVVAWDLSPDPQVVGYRVYVGTEPGVYTETFDVGAVTTSFAYGPREARVYYFAVASYATGPIVGAPSSEVSSFGSPTAAPDPISPPAPDPISPPAPGPISSQEPGPISSQEPSSSIAPPDPGSYWSSLWASATAAEPSQAGRQTETTDCTDTSRAKCESVRTVLTVPTLITSLAATDDGRLFFVEGGRRIRVTTADPISITETLLDEDDPSVVLTHVVVDPAFGETGVLYVGEIKKKGNGRREFRVARYRVRENGDAGERVPIVHGIPLSASGEPHLVIDAQRHLHIAAPSVAVSGAMSLVLRLTADGTVPADNPRGSPFVAGHAGELAAIAWVGDRLWLFDRRRDVTVANAGRALASPFARSSRESGRGRVAANIVSLTGRELAGGSRELLALLSDGTFSRTPVDANGVAGPTRTIVVGRAGSLGRVTTDSQGVYITVAKLSLHGVSSSILRIDPVR